MFYGVNDISLFRIRSSWPNHTILTVMFIFKVTIHNMITIIFLKFIRSILVQFLFPKFYWKHVKNMVPLMTD